MARLKRLLWDGPPQGIAFGFVVLVQDVSLQQGGTWLINHLLRRKRLRFLLRRLRAILRAILRAFLCSLLQRQSKCQSKGVHVYTVLKHTTLDTWPCLLPRWLLLLRDGSEVRWLLLLRDGSEVRSRGKQILRSIVLPQIFTQLCVHLLSCFIRFLAPPVQNAGGQWWGRAAGQSRC